MYKINLVYFSCNRDKEMLKLSIASSRRQYDFNKIYIFSDPNDPIIFGILNDEELCKDDTFLLSRNSGSEKLYGLDNIRDMHECMKIAAADCDYILKKDSDIIDCSTCVYDKLNQNNYDAYGCSPMARESMIPPLHFNGNAYFIKADIINKFTENFPKCVDNWAVMNYPEDMVTSTVCGEITKNIKIDGTAQNGNGHYLFDVFLSRVADSPKENIQKYGFVHCRSNPRIAKYIHDKIYSQN